MRAKALTNLLNSIKKQTKIPNEIIIVDGSLNNDTKEVVQKVALKNLIYYKVDEHNRGLTKQRNFGISKTNSASEIICFLDDDTVLKENYFEEIIKTFSTDKKITGVGGVAINENRWKLKKPSKSYNSFLYYELENFVIREGLRNSIRNLLKLQSNLYPGKMPSFSHGRTYSYPLNNKIYEVDLLVGMSFSFRKIVTDNIKFSTYFEGYGLYEDADFSIRAQQFGKNVISTNCQLYHYHDESGRPNKFKYGKMVVRNGWYVWRLKYPKPNFTSRLKWNALVWVLLLIRMTNVITSTKKKEAFTESFGRVVGWFTLLFDKPQLK